MRWAARERGASAGAGAVPGRTSGAMLRTVGRTVLWCVLALLLVRGAGDVLAGESHHRPRRHHGTRRRRGPMTRRARSPWTSRAVLTYSPRHPRRYARAVLPFVSPDVASAVVPRFARRDSRQVVQSAVIARASRVGDGRALVTVAATVAGRDVSTRYLTVPVARDAGGRPDGVRPAVVLGAARARAGETVELEPLSGAEGAEVQDVLGRFFRAFLAGRSADFEYFVPAGVRIGRWRSVTSSSGWTPWTRSVRARGSEVGPRDSQRARCGVPRGLRAALPGAACAP